MSTLTIQLEDSILDKIAAFARRSGKSAEEVVASVVNSTEFARLEAFEKLQAQQQEAKARLTSAHIQAAFDEIRALNAQPLPGDELPQL